MLQITIMMMVEGGGLSCGIFGVSQHELLYKAELPIDPPLRPEDPCAIMKVLRSGGFLRAEMSCAFTF